MSDQPTPEEVLAGKRLCDYCGHPSRAHHAYGTHLCGADMQVFQVTPCQCSKSANEVSHSALETALAAALATPPVSDKLTSETLREAVIRVRDGIPGTECLEDAFLLAHADAWKARDRKAADDLMRYGKHDRGCRTRDVGLMNATRDDCSCGLWLAIGLPADWRPSTNRSLA